MKKINNIHSIGYRFLGDLPSKKLPLNDFLRKNLDRAGLRMSHIVYLSSMTFWTITATLITGLVSIPSAFILVPMFHLEPNIFTFLIAAPLIAAAITIVSFLYYPMYRRR